MKKAFFVVVFVLLASAVFVVGLYIGSGKAIKQPTEVKVVSDNGASSQNQNLLAHTSWEPRPSPDYSGVAKSQVLDFDEDTFVGRNIYGTVASGKFAVSGNTVTFATMYGVEFGRLSGGRLIIGRTTFYRL